jgi:hypothetical protein
MNSVQGWFLVLAYLTEFLFWLDAEAMTTLIHVCKFSKSITNFNQFITIEAWFSGGLQQK